MKIEHISRKELDNLEENKRPKFNPFSKSPEPLEDSLVEEEPIIIEEEPPLIVEEESFVKENDILAPSNPFRVLVVVAVRCYSGPGTTYSKGPLAKIGNIYMVTQTGMNETLLWGEIGKDLWIPLNFTKMVK